MRPAALSVTAAAAAMLRGRGPRSMAAALPAATAARVRFLPAREPGRSPRGRGCPEGLALAKRPGSRGLAPLPPLPSPGCLCQKVVSEVETPIAILPETCMKPARLTCSHSMYQKLVSLMFEPLGGGVSVFSSTDRTSGPPQGIRNPR